MYVAYKYSPSNYFYGLCNGSGLRGKACFAHPADATGLTAST